MPFQTAAMHSLFFIFGRYSSTILATALLDKYPIRFWTILSIACLVGSYVLVYFTGFFATRDNFVYVQVIFGLLNGIGTGTGWSILVTDVVRGVLSPTVFQPVNEWFSGWTCCNVVSQQWLDKKRAELNPYLLLGAPIISISSLPLFNWLCQTYTWSGACLISAGITLNCVIVILLFDRNSDTLTFRVDADGEFEDHPVDPDQNF